jgi:dTDP-4-dehydrorhamnose reductase
VTTRALILGASGQAGQALVGTAPPSISLVAHDAEGADVRDRDAVDRALADAKADVVINCAAFTNVDDAEARAEEAFQVNAVGAGNVAESARRRGARVIHLSTDDVFDGSAHSPYAVDAPTGPLSVYGSTKLEAERRVLASGAACTVVRTAWLHSRDGANFVRTTLRVLNEGRVMRVVDDQIGTPTRARHLAHALWRIVERPAAGRILHFTDAGVASWFDVATAIMDALGEDARLPAGADVVPITSDEYPTAARRPRYSVLDKHDSWRAIGYTPPHWRHGIVATTHELLNA